MPTVVSLLLTVLLLPQSTEVPLQRGRVASPESQQTPEAPAAPVSAPPTLIAPTVPVPETYVIGKQDWLKITVFEDASLNGTYTVDDADGTIMLPYISPILAAGSTQRQLQDKIRNALSPDIIKNPQVRVEIEKFKSQSVMVTGEVRSPMKVAMMGNKSLLEAITDAGSLMASAGSEIVITHADGRPPTTIDMKDVLGAQAYMLHDQDIVTVPKAQLIYISGEVRNTGGYIWTRDMTLAQLVTLAGGLNDRGKYGGAEAIRLVNGSPKPVGLKEQDRVYPEDQVRIKKRIF
jgi:polysaccharide export outer membrane protein